jgi:hypothetical protein
MIEYRYCMSKYGVAVYEVSGRAMDVIAHIEPQLWDCWLCGASPRAVKVTVRRHEVRVEEHGWL